MESIIQQLETVDEPDGLQDNNRLFSRGLTGVICRHHGQGPVFPDGNISVPRLIPELPDNVLCYHAVVVPFPGTEKKHPEHIRE